jgi:hypothetical protein
MPSYPKSSLIFLGSITFHMLAERLYEFNAGKGKVIKSFLVILIASIPSMLRVEFYRFPLKTVRIFLQGCVGGFVQVSRNGKFIMK